MIDDGTVFRLGDNNFRWIGGNDHLGALAARAGRERRGLDAWVKTSTDELANIALQGPRRAGRSSNAILWTATDLADRRRARMVPVLGRPARRLPRHGARRVPDRLHGRARLRALLPSAGRADAVRRGHGGGRTVRNLPVRPRCPRHGSHRGGARLRGLRVLRSDRPVRGRHRVHRPPRSRRPTTSSAARRSNGARRTPSAGSSGSTSRAASSPRPATACGSGRPRSGKSPPQCARPSSVGSSPCAAWT